MLGRPRQHQWRRSREDRLAGGVAAGLAARIGADVTLVRVGFIVAGLLGAFGVAAYVVAWLVVPAAGADASLASRAVTDRRGIALAAAAASVLVIAFSLVSLLRVSWLAQLAGPLAISLIGLILIWRNAPEDEQAILRRLAEPVLAIAAPGAPSRLRLRVAAAVVLLAAGAGVLQFAHPDHGATLALGGALLFVLAAIAVGFGPWWLRVARDLVVERQARARAEERADLAARVHDSVLQTLALIQRRADDPQKVIQLARAQERELRSWLFDGRAPGSAGTAGATVAAAIRLIQRDVEGKHGVAVEVVTVGDCELDDDLAALLAAAREATVNSAKWSGAAVVSLFAEVEAATVAVYVRDRGRGFDPGAVPEDRRGVSESIQARMDRHGGSAKIRTAPGEGTEIALTMPRHAREDGEE